MANRRFVQFGGTLEAKVVKLFAKIVYAGGVPVLVTDEVLNLSTSPISINPSLGIESLTDTGNGFTLVLGANNGGVPTYDTYIRLLGVSAMAVSASSPQLIVASVVADNVNGQAGNPSLEIQTFVTAGGGTTGPLADGSVLLLEITLSNSSAY